MVAFLLAAGANVNIQSEDGDAPLFHIHTVSESTIDVVTTLLRAGASLDRQGSIRSFEEYLDIIVEWNASHAEHVDSIRTLVASVRAAGSWKAHCRLAHKQVLRLRSLVVRGRAKFLLRDATRAGSSPSTFSCARATTALCGTSSLIGERLGKTLSIDIVPT